MSDLTAVRILAGPTAAALEASRRRIDDLNVYPVPDGDTGTNLTLTVRAVVEALDRLDESTRERLAREIARAALMGARGNSGVIFSQIVRGFAEVVGEAEVIDSPTLARAFRGASDAAYRAVRKPVEGTMLTVIRELAEEAEAQARPDLPVADLLRALLVRGEDALARTPQYLEILRAGGCRRRGRRRADRARPRAHLGGHGRGASGHAARARGGRVRRDPPGAVEVPLLHGVRRRGRGARPRRGSRTSWRRSATR